MLEIQFIETFDKYILSSSKLGLLFIRFSIIFSASIILDLFFSKLCFINSSNFSSFSISSINATFSFSERICLYKSLNLGNFISFEFDLF